MATPQTFDFTARPDPTPQPPINGRTPQARHASWTGAREAIKTWTHKQSAYLQLLTQAGSLTDQEAAALLHWPLSSVNSIRNGLTDRIVTDGYDLHQFTNSHGTPCTTKRTKWKVRS